MQKFSHKLRAFTLVEILVVLFLVGLVALPFTNMFLFGVQGSHDNAEHVLSYNLAREKLEEIKGLPFEVIKSDYENFREVFQDRQKYDEAYYNEASFEKYFSDVFTDRSLNDSELKTTFTRLKQIYPKAYLKPLQTYPEDYRNFRRVVKAEQISESAMPSKMKKISVFVYDGDGKKTAEIATFIGQHK
ncbi:MAG TPA: prepilin-type N-terminal cleavage/methylation domain-containing protein [Candidatus Ozemobacteraceae bacterium]|nr:prepilin-type N-terminal cleavage/methylation domain-containing protein [Candidatus Ozemobacteraceae bacterium]